jgi:hypothetical protein
MTRQAAQISESDEQTMRNRLWALFGDKDFGPERFDHSAAEFYVTAQDPSPATDDDTRVRKLILRQLSVRIPWTDEFSELDPRYGKITRSTLANGDYGEFQIVSNRAIKLFKPQTSIPPRVLRIHLCWGVGLAGIAAYHVAAKDTPPRADASVLQGLVASLLDDWQLALGWLPDNLRVKLFLHRMHDPAYVEVETSRRRWRLNTAEESPLRAEVVRLIFKRSDAVTVSYAKNWELNNKTAGGIAWRCGCLLRDDLKGLGFVEMKSFARQDYSNSLGWESYSSPLPANLSHVITVDPSTGDCSILAVFATPGNTGRMTLQPLRRYPCQTSKHDLSFCALRVAARKFMLDEVQARLAI